LRQEAARRKVFQPLYEFARTFLASAALSNESVKYYASLVQFYTVYKLQRSCRCARADAAKWAGYILLLQIVVNFGGINVAGP
jgi:hypothetical protein